MKFLTKILSATILSLLSRSLPLYAQTAELYYEKGEGLLIKKDTHRAFESFRKAVDLSKQNNEWDQYVRTVNRLASLQKVLTQEEIEITFLQLKDAVEPLKNHKQDSNIAQLNFYLADFYDSYSHEIDLPVNHFQKAIKIWTSLQGESSKHVAACYHGLGDIYKYKKNDFEEAERCYEKALKIREHIHFDDARILTSNYYNLALTNRSQADYEKALAYGMKALMMTQQLNSAIYSEMSNAMVANIYRDMDESILAKKYYLNAIALNKKTNDQGNLAWYYLGLGDLSKNDSVYDDALRYFKKAYVIYKKIDADKLLLVYLIQIMNETYTLKKDVPAFYRTFHELFRELKALNMLNSRLAAQGYIGAADFHFRSFRYDSALFYYQRALHSALPAFQSSDPSLNPSESIIGVNYYVYDILKGKAFVLDSLFARTHQKAYFDQSLQCLFLAEKLLSLQRNTLDMEDSKWRFLESKYNIYEAILSILHEGVRQYQDDSLLRQAFRYFEQSKVRTLADALVEAERTRDISRQDTLFRMHTDLKRKMFAAQDKLNQELETASSGIKVVQLREEIVKYDREIQTYKSAIEERYPGYFNVRYGYQTPDLKKVQEIIARDGRVLIEYFWGNQSVYALCILPNEVTLKRIGAPDSIRPIVNLLLKNFGDNHSSIDNRAYQDFTQSAHQLYTLLVQPFQSQLQGKTRLQIIPDGMISQIPFEVLLEQEANHSSINYRSLPYLLKHYTIGYTYSSGMLVHSVQKTIRKPTLLAFGFTGGQRLRAPDAEPEEIEGTEKELAALATHFSSGKFLAGNEATETNFKALAPDFDIIHLAIHGKGDVQKKFTASLFFRKKYDSLEDGELHAYELYGLKLKARMAVLTSCEAGLGKDYKGEGMLSMASAFTYSGCENILMSLWKVNDQASIDLMTDFYEPLLNGATIDDALRQAKLNYLEKADEVTADPFIWAPMVAYGSLDEVFQNNKSRMVWSVVGIATLLLAILFLYLKRKKFNGFISEVFYRR